MRHLRGSDRKALKKSRILAVALREHNKTPRRWGYGSEGRWNGIEDIPRKTLHRMFRDEGKRAVWRCSPKRCSYCLMNCLHRVWVRNDAMEADFKFWADGGYEDLERLDDRWGDSQREVRNLEREIAYLEKRLEEAREELWEA